ncbi:DUF6250 domain-containing protein [Plebeiibacterium marinum]|uniref:DUF6250 domain-containing protein n=1 Tax=Plebeiibacterium marinum TaxID=2992111 RepID=A0AAE3MFI6_9BACT|nr:DUF6250 domain-containing protein [Plebeiobacterium marinum]MCW3806652.1 DUF6250 domain-containing protein [Plebeiobacterium marinum]
MNSAINIVVLLFLIVTTSCNINTKTIRIYNNTLRSYIIYEDNFYNDLENWSIEQKPGGTVSIINKKLDINDADGCTVWFNKKLCAPLIIEYDAVVIDDGGINDRVSDLNCFWMANDIHEPEDFFKRSATRGGIFQNYHDMQLYYVGLGGHNNTKTRFRRYAGKGERPCLPEHDLNDSIYLITPNIKNKIRLVVYKKHIQYYRNDQLIYDVIDENPYTEGYFGIRTYKNHMTVDNFKVYGLVDNSNQGLK